MSELETIKAELSRLKKNLSDTCNELVLERKVVDYYAALSSWRVYSKRRGIRQRQLIPASDCTEYEDSSQKLLLGGKRARQRQRQRGSAFNKEV